MKKLIFAIFMLLIGIPCFAQEVELSGSLTNSFNEPRLQNAFGIGVQYQHDIGQLFKLGFGVHYNYKHANFHEEYSSINSMYSPHWVEEINSKYNRFSGRLNIQGMLKENESASISFGPEISYNFFWGEQNWSPWTGGPLSQRGNPMIRNFDVLKKFGYGIIIEIEVKNFIVPKLSLCSTIRPEITRNITKLPFQGYGSYPILQDKYELVEFQIGVKYKFKN